MGDRRGGACWRASGNLRGCFYDMESRKDEREARRSDYEHDRDIRGFEHDTERIEKLRHEMYTAAADFSAAVHACTVRIGLLLESDIAQALVDISKHMRDAEVALGRLSLLFGPQPEATVTNAAGTAHLYLARAVSGVERYPRSDEPQRGELWSWVVEENRKADEARSASSPRQLVTSSADPTSSSRRLRSAAIGESSRPRYVLRLARASSVPSRAEPARWPSGTSERPRLGPTASFTNWEGTASY